jgi:hypothetical protein
MRKMMVLTVVVAALGMASELAEARDRGFSFRHFSGHAGPKLHLRDPGYKFHRGGFVGKGRAFKSQRFGHVGQHGFASKFGHAPEFKSRHFGHLRQRGLVLEFGDGDVMLRFSHVPFKHGHFSHTRQLRDLFFGFEPARPFRPWHNRGFAFEDPRGIHALRQSMPGSQGSRGGGLQDGAPPEALLRELEQMGFRHVPELLRSRNP